MQEYTLALSLSPCTGSSTLLSVPALLYSVPFSSARIRPYCYSLILQRLPSPPLPLCPTFQCKNLPLLWLTFHILFHFFILVCLLVCPTLQSKNTPLSWLSHPLCYLFSALSHFSGQEYTLILTLSAFSFYSFIIISSMLCPIFQCKNTPLSLLSHPLVSLPFLYHHLFSVLSHFSMQEHTLIPTLSPFSFSSLRLHLPFFLPFPTFQCKNTPSSLLSHPLASRPFVYSCPFCVLSHISVQEYTDPYFLTLHCPFRPSVLTCSSLQESTPSPSLLHPASPPCPQGSPARLNEGVFALHRSVEVGVN